MKQLPLTHALFWIVGSMLCVSGLFYPSIKTYIRLSRGAHKAHIDTLVCSIVQTGPQKGALKTEYLAEILGICADYPRPLASYDLKQLEQKLRASPLIAEARVSLRKPNSLYIDYTVRQPCAFLADFENVALDKEGCLFPFAPFFSPKNLPQIYLGLAPFSTLPTEAEKPVATWGRSLKGKYLDLAYEILAYTSDPKVADLFRVTWIDVSHAFSTRSAAEREIILMTEELLFSAEGEPHPFTHLLRLSTKELPQQLGNYLKLRVQLLEGEQKTLYRLAKGENPVKIIDLRIPKLAFLEGVAQ
jgi:hypothetical protein